MPVDRAPAAQAPLLEMRQVTKRFPGVVANDRIDLTVRAGEVHALLGENGAGKSTLVHILYGLQPPDEGRILLRGEPVRFRSPRDAMTHGVGLVAQHFHLARRHTVAENLALAMPDAPRLFPARHVRGRARAIARKYGFELDPNARVAALSPGEQQRVEIVKALLQGAEILVLDEPTSVLTPQEAQRLFGLLARMTDEGKGVVFISHKLDEVLSVAHRVTVLRGGRVVGRREVEETDAGELATLMVGRTVARALSAESSAGRSTPGEPRLRVRDLVVRNERNETRLGGVSFDVRRGEILGVAGVSGNGQAELAQVLTGLIRPQSGSIFLDEANVAGLNVRGLFDRGVVHIPEDRNEMGVAGGMRVSENLVLRRHRQRPFAKGRLLDWREVARHADGAIRDYAIATPGRNAVTRQLSGGNVQKVILARELGGEPGLVVASHPTYGLDVSASELTQRLLREQRDRGAAVLLISEDLDELLELSDRVLVLFRGRSMGVLDAAGAERERIGLMMAGHERPERPQEGHGPGEPETPAAAAPEDRQP